MPVNATGSQTGTNASLSVEAFSYPVPAGASGATSSQSTTRAALSSSIRVSE
jgi:hypothetical protein